MIVLREEKERRQGEERRAKQQVTKLDTILPILTERAEDQNRLAKKKMLPRQQNLEIEQERIAALFDLRSQEDRVAKLRAALRELDARAASTRSEFKRQLTERLEDAEQRENAIKLEFVKARTDVTADYHRLGRWRRATTCNSQYWCDR